MDAPQKSLLWLGFLGGLGAFGLLWYSSLSTGRDKISDVGKQRRSRTTGATSPQGQHEAESPTAQALLRTTRSRSALNHSSMANSPRQEQQDLAQDETEENTRDLLRDTHEELVESEKVLEALLSLAEEAARKEGYIHRSITCNHCQTSPIKGFRFKCANCSDFDLCENCESLGVHSPNHVFLKIKIPLPPLANPRFAVAPLFYPGSAGFERNSRAKDIDWPSLVRETHFDAFELEACLDQFLSLIPENSQGLDPSNFEKCLGPIGLERSLISERVFRFFDGNGDGLVSFEEFCKGLSVLTKGDFDERVYHAFQGYDLDGNGFISRLELRRMFKAYFHLSLELVRDVVKTMEDGLLEGFDEEDAKPVSAAFSAPIVSSGPPEDSVEGANQNGNSTKKHIDQGTILGDDLGTVKENRKRSPSPLKTTRFKDGTESEASSPTADEASSPTLLPGPLRIHRDFPVMEAMGHQALEDMVEQTFKDAGCEEKNEMNLEEFTRVAEKDANILAWFEALGSVF